MIHMKLVGLRDGGGVVVGGSGSGGLVVVRLPNEYAVLISKPV